MYNREQIVCTGWPIWSVKISRWHCSAILSGQNVARVAADWLPELPKPKSTGGLTDQIGHPAQYYWPPTISGSFLAHVNMEVKLITNPILVVSPCQFISTNIYTDWQWHSFSIARCFTYSQFAGNVSRIWTDHYQGVRNVDWRQVDLRQRGQGRQGGQGRKRRKGREGEDPAPVSRWPSPISETFCNIP